MQPLAVSWWSASTVALSAEAYGELVSVCSASELARSRKFVHAHDARAYLAAHGLLRHALSAAEPWVAAGAWRFSAGRYGRPELEHRHVSNLRFNLSHCPTRVSCIVCPDLDCGIDVEPSGRQQRLAGNDLHFLGPAERAWLASQPDAAQEASFMRFWTLKEAVAKAVGLGLQLPLAQLEFELAPIPRLAAGPAAVSGPWWLHQAHTQDGHVESLALRTSAAIDLVRREWPAAGRLCNPYPQTVAPTMPMPVWSVW